MTTDLALEYIPRRMRELGYGDQYLLRFAHLVLQPNEVRSIDGSDQFFILVEEPVNIRVESDMGIFDMNASNTNEMIYEHQGQITVTNQFEIPNSVRFIQVIPKNDKKD